MNFLVVATLAYVFVAGAAVVDKILLRKSVSSPLVYTFDVNVLQFLVLALIPFGFSFSLDNAFYLAAASGITSVLALYAFFVSLKVNEASVASSLIGAFNPIFALILGSLLLSQNLTFSQTLAVFVLIGGSLILTFNRHFSTLEFNHKFLPMIISGFLFGLSYVLLRQAFLETSFVNGLVVSRIAAALFVLTFLLIPSVKKEIFSKRGNNAVASKGSLVLMLFGQSMAAISGLLITYGITLTSPAIINSMFGIQYPAIILFAYLVSKKFPHVIDERLSGKVIIQKVAGVIILSLGLYLLAR